MNEYGKAFKEGVISGIGTFGATALTAGGIMVVTIAAIFYYILVALNAILGLNTHGDGKSPIELSLSAVCDTYQYWYEKITNAIKNLVK